MISRRLVLHVGMPKAGSSAIQKYLRKKAAFYALNGIAIEDFGAALIACSTDRCGVIPDRLGSADARTYVCSHESLFSKLRSSIHTERLSSILRAHFDDIDIVIYIRRQDELFVSGYYNRCLYGCEPFDSMKFKYKGPMNLNESIELWERSFGIERVKVRRYGNEYFHAGDILQDFCNAADIPYRHTTFSGANFSPSIEELELLRLLVRASDGHIPRKHLIRFVCGAGIQGTRLGLSAFSRQAILRQCSKDNQLIAQRYFGQSDLFTHAIPDDGVPYPSLSTDQIFTMLQAIFSFHGAKAPQVPQNSDPEKAIVAAARAISTHLTSKMAAVRG